MRLTWVLGASGVVAFASESPRWGCGLLGALPGIGPGGQSTAEMQKMIDGIKVSSSVGKVHYWNWNLAPETTDGAQQYLTKDFIFMPEQWGIGAVEDKYLREAGKSNFLDGDGQVCPAEMANIFLGANEPDMIGSCMGNMFGQCTGPCTAGEVAAGNCPTASLKPGAPPASPNAAGHCDCWSQSHATGSGFWPFQGCAGPQPLPKLFDDNGCVGTVMAEWKKTAAIVANKGYTYLSTPLVAWNMDWLRSFIQAACTGCSEPSCGCPSHVGWHFYASDCRPKELGGYADFQSKLDKTAALMEEFPFLQGAVINEVGMLNCAQDGPAGACVTDGHAQKYPASSQPNHRCPVTDELPNGLATFVEEVLKMVASAKTSDGRSVVAAFSWFNLDMAGGTYNLRLFDDNGSVNEVGQAYIRGCQAWAGVTPPSPPSPTPPSPPAPPAPAPPAPPSPGPVPTPPPTPNSPSCKVGDAVACPGSPAGCGGNQCCPDGSMCPSAAANFNGCPLPKKEDCTTPATNLVV